MTTTRKMTDIRLTPREIELVKEAYKRNAISKEYAVEFLFFVDNAHFTNGNVFGGENIELTNSRLDAQARKFKKQHNL